MSRKDGGGERKITFFPPPLTSPPLFSSLFIPFFKHMDPALSGQSESKRAGRTTERPALTPDRDVTALSTNSEPLPGAITSKAA